VNSTQITGTARSCATASKDECKNETDGIIRELGLTNGNGIFCYCTGDLCNVHEDVTLSPDSYVTESVTPTTDSKGTDSVTTSTYSEVTEDATLSTDSSVTDENVQNCSATLSCTTSPPGSASESPSERPVSRNSVPPVSVGRMALSLSVVSFLAFVAARFVNQ